jgi:hypothetical protein
VINRARDRIQFSIDHDGERPRLPEGMGNSALGTPSNMVKRAISRC